MPEEVRFMCGTGYSVGSGSIEEDEEEEEEAVEVGDALSASSAFGGALCGILGLLGGGARRFALLDS